MHGEQLHSCMLSCEMSIHRKSVAGSGICCSFSRRGRGGGVNVLYLFVVVVA